MKLKFNLFSHSLFLIGIFLLVSCTPKEEFLPNEMMALGARGLAEKNEENKLIEEEKNAEIVFDETDDTAVGGTLNEAPWISNIDQVFSNSVRKISSDVRLTELMDAPDPYLAMINLWNMNVNGPSPIEYKPINYNETGLHFYLNGKFMVGDKIHLYPDRGCMAYNDRLQDWNQDITITINRDYYKIVFESGLEFDFLEIPGTLDIPIAFSLPGYFIDEGDFFPTMRYERNGELSKCYNMLSDNWSNLRQDSVAPDPPGVFRVKNKIGVNRKVELELYRGLEANGIVELFKGKECLGNPIQLKRISNLTGMNFVYELADDEIPEVGQYTELFFVSRIIDAAKNIGVCSKSVSYKEFTISDTLTISLKQVLNSNETTSSGVPCESCKNSINYIGNNSRATVQISPVNEDTTLKVFSGSTSSSDCGNDTSVIGEFYPTASNSIGEFVYNCSFDDSGNCTIVVGSYFSGEKTCSNQIIYHLDQESPVVQLANDRLQGTLTDNQTSPTYVISKINKGLSFNLSTDNTIKYANTRSDGIKLIKHADDSCSDKGEELSTDYLGGFFIYKPNISEFMSEDVYFSFKDKAFNQSDCIAFKLYWEEASLRMRPRFFVYQRSDLSSIQEVPIGIARRGEEYLNKLFNNKFLDDLVIYENEETNPNVGFFYNVSDPDENFGDILTFKTFNAVNNSSTDVIENHKWEYTLLSTNSKHCGQYTYQEAIDNHMVKLNASNYIVWGENDELINNNILRNYLGNINNPVEMISDVTSPFITTAFYNYRNSPIQDVNNLSIKLFSPFHDKSLASTDGYCIPLNFASALNVADYILFSYDYNFYDVVTPDDENCQITNKNYIVGKRVLTVDTNCKKVIVQSKNNPKIASPTFINMALYQYSPESKFKFDCSAYFSEIDGLGNYKTPMEETEVFLNGRSAGVNGVNFQELLFSNTSLNSIFSVPYDNSNSKLEINNFQKDYLLCPTGLSSPINVLGDYIKVNKITP